WTCSAYSGEAFYDRIIEGTCVKLGTIRRGAFKKPAFDENAEAEITEEQHFVSMRCGTLTVTVDGGGNVSFRNNDKVILAEKPEHTFGGRSRRFVNKGHQSWTADVSFWPHENEHFFGMGHSWDNEFDLKGTVIDLKHINAKCTVPYVYSSLGYGFLWNVPSIGRVDFAKNKTRWHSDCCQAIDYVVIGGSPAETCEMLADLTGHAPVMPDWATGFWQCRLRYESQEELLAVYRKYRELGIPLSAIIVDYFHWTEQGDYKFDPQYWPDVKAMADEIHETGTKLLVSMWPTINQKSENYRHMLNNNMLIRTSRGSDRLFDFYGWQAQIDVSNPATREFVWSKLKENYADKGVDAFWFDVSESEIWPEHFDNLITSRGRGEMTALMYPYDYARLVYDGQKAMGKDDIVTLIRGAYLGSQKYAALVWSGDIPSTFESLQHQVNAGLNMAMCGIPWWNTDIGGFYGGDTQSDYFRELIVRWFQFGLFCPVMRLHGNRVRHYQPKGIIEPSGDPNEIWSFGERNFEIIKKILRIRENLRPYIGEQMKTASEKGWPVIRPMFFTYPEDEKCWTLNDQYMFGDDILFAPIMEQGKTARNVYLPEGEWVLAKDGTEYTGGTHEIHAQIDEFIAFVRKGASVLDCFRTE
ncbi:MAG: hypothetical protein IJC71_00970, partial [Clostridia bacterium]|nr:hypothetical protein [Clostridia bacterium]